MVRLIESYGDGLVGIWWFTGDKIIGEAVPVDDGVLCDTVIQYDSSKNHLSDWSKVVKYSFESEDEAKEIIDKGYKHFERGRVIFNILTLSYTVTCSEALKNNNDFREKVLSFFNLQNKRVDFEVLDHYYQYTKTGNPALDDFEGV